MESSVIRALESGALLLTANRRLRRGWRQAFDASQQRQGRAAWAAPAIFEWQQWLERRFLESLDTRSLLSPLAVQRLWQSILPSGVLLDREATAEAVNNSWKLVLDYRLDLTHPAFQETEDSAQFADWAEAFTQRLRSRNLMAPAALGVWASENLEGVPPEVWLAGFSEKTPLQRAALAAMTAAGSRVHEVEAAAEQANAARCVLPDSEAELRSAAVWARSKIEHGGAKSVGVVVSGLQGLRAKVEAIFEDSLGGRYFNLSLGKPLASYPMAATALQLMRLFAGSLPYAEASSLLLSPFLGAGVSEFARRARLDSDLRRRNLLRVSLRDLRARAIPAGCTDLAHSLEKLLARQHAASERRSPGEWARELSVLLQVAGWPGERTLNSEERQTQIRWLDLLRELSTVDIVEPAISFAEAVHIAGRLARTALFQPETGDLPIHILEALQATGSNFDALWVAGMTDEVWPPPASPDPFLPKRLQREFDLPHATAERELRFSRDVIAGLRKAAPDIVFSSPASDGDLDLRPSTLISGLPLAALEVRRPFQPKPAPMEEFVDWTAPALSEPLQGGTAILKWQAQCPFRAFAELRLKAVALEDPKPGLSPKDRGMILHRAMEYIWNDLHDQATLQSLDAAALQAVIGSAVERACESTEAAGREALIRLEAQRLQKLLSVWLAYERDERAPFSVEAFEVNPKISTAGITTRVDRLDRLQDGSLVILDYKTGANTKSDWTGERPNDLQLPFYAVNNPETPKAIAMARMKVGKLGFDGLGARGGLLPGVTGVAWDQQLGQWRASIDRLQEEFQAGVAHAGPKSAKVCGTCHLQGLCRIHEQAIVPEEEEANA